MYYGIDLGGSKIEIAVFDEQWNSIWQRRVPTPSQDYQALLTQLAELVQQADQQSATQGTVGIGLPGVLDEESQQIFLANIPAAMGKPLQQDLQQRIGRQVKMENDANCFALSEAWAPEFRHYPSVLGLILGTGVGSGLIINGQVFRGRNGIAGELGHLSLPVDALDFLGSDIARLPCGCGHHGCLENYISGRGFEWLYHHFYHHSLTAPAIIERYYAGESNAVAHVDRFLQLLAICLANILTVLDPHLLVLGGGLSNFPLLYTELPRRLPSYLLSVAKLPAIEAARYGDAGGVRGAALLNLVSG